METYDIIYYICETTKRGHDKILASTNFLDGAKEMVKSLREDYPEQRFFITQRLKEED